MKDYLSNYCYQGIKFILYFFCLYFFANKIIYAQTGNDSLSTDILKQLSLEELMNIDITIVSKRPQQLFDAPAAVYVIQSEDIKRSGATRIPEALRLSTNMEVAQIGQNQWAISTRGFNSSLANKLLVLIDGRSVYSPLFAGVFWDLQNVFLNDIDRIEVIGGPGATLWGANAVNGVINIVSKNAHDTKGLFVEGGGGTELKGFGGIRYGGSFSPDFHYRIYAKYFYRDGTVSHSGQDSRNDWSIGQGGFRLDWEESDANNFTLQGDIYESTLSSQDTTDPVSSGGNVIGLWTHNFSEESELKLQFYFDRVHRNIPGSYNDMLNTYDIDFQHHFPAGTWNDIIWGAGYRINEDNFMPGSIIFEPQKISLQTFSAFIQDEIALVKNRLSLTLGTKYEHNDYSGSEYQPSIRLLWKPGEQQTLWSAISRAVRTPSRLDRNWLIPMVTSGSPDYDSEILVAYELGYRIQPSPLLSLSLATYYNVYDKIRSIEQVNPLVPVPLVFGNKLEADTYGAELTMNYKVMDWWLLRLGYSLLKVDFRTKAGSTDQSSGRSEAADSDHNFMLNSSIDLPANLKLDIVFRYISQITNPNLSVPDYSELDLRIAWQLMPQLEFSVAGQNLLHKQHAEYGDVVSRQEIERNIYGKISFSL